MGDTQCCEKPLLLETHPPIVLSDKKLMNYSKIRDIRLMYENLSTLGSGSFGKVRLFRSKLYPDLKYAIKTLKKEGISKLRLECLRLEVDILRSIDHPNIVRFFTTLEDNKFLHISMMFLSGENLSKIILNSHNKLPERQVCLIMKQIFKALVFLQNKKIVHRDLKPENILFGTKGDLNTLNIIDFGLAQYSQADDTKSCGSPLYMSPELIAGKFCPKTDVWAAGVILYYILTDTFPFDKDKDGNIFQNIQKKPLNVKFLKKSRGSSQAVDLVTKLLVKNVEERLSAKQALEHAWFKKFEVLDEEEDAEEIKRLAKLEIPPDEITKLLKDFCTKSYFQKEILYFIAKFSIDDDIKEIKELFLNIDSSNCAELCFKDFKNGLKKKEIKLKNEEYSEVWDNLDFHKTGKITYSEFLAAFISRKKKNLEQKLLSAFVFFEDGDIGYITYETFIESTDSLNTSTRKDEVKKTFDLFSGGHIDFSDFKKIFDGKIKSF